MVHNHSHFNGKVTRCCVLLQISCIIPSGLYQFTVNYEIINPLDSQWDSVNRQSAHM